MTVQLFRYTEVCFPRDREREREREREGFFGLWSVSNSKVWSGERVQ